MQMQCVRGGGAHVDACSGGAMRLCVHASCGNLIQERTVAGFSYSWTAVWTLLQAGYSSVGRASDCREFADIRSSLVRFRVAGAVRVEMPLLTTQGTAVCVSDA